MTSVLYNTDTKLVPKSNLSSVDRTIGIGQGPRGL